MGKHGQFKTAGQIVTRQDHHSQLGFFQSHQYTHAIIHITKVEGLNWVQHGQHEMLSDWLQAIPPCFIAKDAWLLFFSAYCRQRSETEVVLATYRDALELFTRQDHRDGQLVTISGMLIAIYLAGEDLSRADPLIKQATELIGASASIHASHCEQVFHICREIHQLVRHGYHLGDSLFFSDVLQPVPAFEVKQENVTAIRTRKQQQRTIAISYLLQSFEDMQQGSLPQRSYIQILTHFQSITGHADVMLPLATIHIAVTGRKDNLSTLIHIQQVEKYLQLGELDEAEKILCMFSRYRQRPTLTQALLLRAKAWLCIRTGKCQQGIDILSESCILFEAAHANGHLKQAQLLLTLARIQAGQWKRAEKLLNHLRNWARIHASHPFAKQCAVIEMWLLSRQYADTPSMWIAKLQYTVTLLARDPHIIELLLTPEIVQEIFYLALKHNAESGAALKMIKQKQLAPPSSLTVQKDEWPWMIRFQSFGTFNVWIGDNKSLELEWKGKMMLALLKTIVAMGGNNVPISAVLNCLWPGTETDKATQNLEFNLRRLRNHLASKITHDNRNRDWLIINSGHISLNPELCWLDQSCFEQLSCMARKQRLHNQPDQAFQSEYDASELIRAPFMPDDIHSDFYAERQQIHQKYSRWLLETAQQWIQEERGGESLALLEKGREFDPLSERLCAALVERLAHTGWTVSAIQIWQDWEQAVRQELGVKASDRMKALYQQVLSQHT